MSSQHEPLPDESSAADNAIDDARPAEHDCRAAGSADGVTRWQTKDALRAPLAAGRAIWHVGPAYHTRKLDAS